MEEYTELGLTKNEGKVYETLVESGKLSAGETSKHSGVSYSKIYDVLNSLTNKGLVDVIPEKTKKFVPSDPKVLIEYIEKREKVLEKAKEKARTMRRLYEEKEKNPVIIDLGKRGFYKIVKEMKETEKYSYNIKWTSETRPDWMGNSERLLKKGKDIRVLARYDKETEKNIEDWLKINKNIRKFPNEGIAFSVVDDKEVMIALIKANVTLLIKNAALAKIMKTFFLDSYKNAEKIQG